MKKIIKPFILFLSIFMSLTLFGCSDQFSDDKLNDLYEDLYGGSSNDDALSGLTDEQLKDYYDNLYGVGGNDLTEFDDYVSSSETIYTFDNETNEYMEYLSQNYLKAYMIQDSSQKITYNKDHQGDSVSILTDTGETLFRYGVAISGADACYTYTDVMQQGYESFSGYFGVHYLARYTNSTSTSFNFRFFCDGVEVYTTKTFNKDSIAEYVEIDLDGVEVFQIVVNTQGSGTGDYMAMGNPKFTKEKATAYLDVFDLEFNLPSQVTPENILQYAKAYDLSSNNISADITYETNYVKGSTGQFDVTYFISHEVKGETITREQTVKMDVYNIDYSAEWTVEDFKTPYVNYLYHARQTYSPQMKKLFDLILDAGLNFDDNDWYKRYRSNIYTSQNFQSFNLASHGIYLKYNEVNRVLDGLWDCEPRIFMLLELDLMGSYYCGTSSTTGLTSSAGFWAQNLTTEQYDARIETILGNAETFLSAAKDDMTYAQKWKYVTDAYNSKVTYTDGANLYNSMGLLKAKCNGNSQGLVFLAQRLSMQSIYANGGTYAGFHAWSYQKLPDDNTWYLTDKLWYTTLGTVEGYTSSHSVYTNLSYTFPTVSKVAYSSSNYTYPSIWASFNNDSVVINKNEEFDIEGNLTGINGVFNDIFLNYTLDIAVKNENGDIVSNDTSKLEAGKYTIVYTLGYKSDLYDVSREYEIDLMIIGNLEDYDPNTLLGHESASYGTSVGIYNGSGEERYSGYNINNAGYITISNDGYDSLSFKFSTTEAVRNDSWASANCKISVSVYFDGVLQTTSAQITAFSTYIQIDVYIPDGVSEIKIKVNSHSSGGTHGCVADIKFGRFDS